MQTLPESSLLGIQTIHLCHGLHYSKHDLCFTPQPINFTLVPHLALIPYPGSLDTITLDLVALLEKEFFEILVNLDSKALKADPKGKEYCTCICILLSCLLSPATFQQALMTWRLAQRNCLELHAHIIWLSKVKPTFTSEHAWETHEVRSVIGAITDKREVLEYCFRAGIPVSFDQAYKNKTQRLAIKVDQQVLKWLDKVEPPPTRPVPDYLYLLTRQFSPGLSPAAEVVLPLPTSSVVPVQPSNFASTSSGSSSSTYNDGLHTSAKQKAESLKDWRRMLGLELFGQKDTGSLESNKRKRLCANLQSAASASRSPNTSMDFDISNLNSIVPAWKEKKYEGSIPDDICREVLTGRNPLFFS
ncbi:hypothetical protein BT96DRAFT_948799 [Gymnopus androsaceus JB14]|uniref:Uncharacterized protein n=1 Tax=Gymnopus androsaceus JB14 TaxID=1447944 RepID=A0A6A4GNN1_9AGAR|nr:hypothetical protein BT96DRAFT_948799 [Gymnopus androsaceus JB14]